MPSNAVRLSDFGSGIGTFGAVLQVDNTNKRIGIGTTNPQSTLQVGVAITMDGAAGIITATKFVGPMEGTLTGNISGTAAGLSGTPDITIRNITGVAATFTGVVSYEDVNNVDSVGVVTARAGLNVVGGGATVTGVSTFFGDVSIADKIIHTGDTNTAIRFPAADTFTVETGGSEAFRVDSSQQLLLGTTSSFEVGSSASDVQLTGSLAFPIFIKIFSKRRWPNLIFANQETLHQEVTQLFKPMTI